MKLTRKLMMIGTLACVGTAFASAASAQAPAPPPVPKGWSYELDSHGNRVAKSKRVTLPDGSWREEMRQGNCLTVKERSATGEYRETRQCNGKPG